MIDYIVAVFFLTAVKFILRPAVIIPLAGILISFQMLSGKSGRFWIIGLFILAGIIIEIFEYSLSGYRERFLDSRLTIYFHNFPGEIADSDRLLHALTFFPSLVILFLLLYGGLSFLSTQAIKSPFLLSIPVSFVCLFLVISNDYIRVPAWSPNGRPDPKEKFFPVHEAARDGDLNSLRTLIRDNRELINRKTNKSLAPLHLAVTGGHFEATKFLVESGADINLMGMDFKPRTPLMLAAEKGDRKTVEFLLEKGADPHILTGEGNNVLYSAREHPDIFKLLMGHKVNLRTINMYGESILSIAARMEDNFRPHPRAYELVKFIMERGLPPGGLPEEEAKPLVEAATASNLKVMRLLIEKGARPDVKDKFQRTPLIVSVLKRSPEMVRLLLKNGANPNLPGSTPGLYGKVYSPLGLVDHIGTSSGIYDEKEKKKIQEIRSLLVKAGAE